jgi:uncharacterized membrane protein YhiD involved in acid resistance
MFTAISVGFAKFFAKLTPSKMINIVLLIGLFFLYSHSQDLKKERDDYKDRYQTEQDNHNKYVKSIQDARDKQTVDCNDILRAYTDRKNKEIEDLSREFKNKYLEVLTLYQRLLEKDSKCNEISK